jgi:hypothetical protein
MRIGASPFFLPPCLFQHKSRLLHLSNEHAVAITVKAVFRSHRVAIRGDNVFFAGESAYQREQRRAGKMKVC